MRPHHWDSIEMENETVEKKEFQSTDFKFIAAYGVYSNNFDEATENEEKQRLNDLITKLDSEEISYPEFYEAMQEDDSERRYRFHRSRIDGSRKFAYRRDEQKRDRIRRHKR